MMLMLSIFKQHKGRPVKDSCHHATDSISIGNRGLIGYKVKGLERKTYNPSFLLMEN